MTGIKLIEFEKYGYNTILSATNKNTNFRIARMPARILYKLVDNLDKPIEKHDLVILLWGRDDYFLRRSFNVHLNKVKKILIGTRYKVIVNKSLIGVYKQSEINDGSDIKSKKNKDGI